ncbi:glycosyltransferase [Pedobacter polaris]|uniref:Glycosyltransferase n=1 Tax=Pedobacter polaris TaxID=2571273 RepID=A0A4U1CUI2_9SPHI|nr:glycosyltransferase family 2 protein [Pedobacter polaris]TKC12897.1 glycosyltransferase [Pedobacter polaris]
MDPLISIITINYNNKTGLHKTIKSVIDQTNKNFEFIVIDGASTDGSTALIALYQEHFTYKVSEPDKGIYQAMNKGIKMAKGQFLLFLNSGDTLSNSTILHQVTPYLYSSTGIIYGNSAYLEPNGKVIRTYPDELSFDFFFSQNLSHQASFIRKSLFTELFLYNEDYKIASDWEFFMYAICKANIAYRHIDLVICDYDVSGISSITTNHKVMNEERRLTLEKYFPLFIKDYEKMKVFNSKRGRHFLYIQKHNFAYKILKGMMNLILYFLPKAK